MKQIYSLEHDGFTILPGIFGKEVLQSVRDLTRSIIQYADDDRVDVFERYYMHHRADQGVLYDLYQRHPEFGVMAKNADILNVLESVLGPDIFLYENSLVYKPKGKKNGVPWHQDFISRKNEPIKYIAWMPIDDVTKETGALKVIPGSHKLGFLPWYRVKGETHHDRLDITSLDVSDAMHVELKAGDVLIFNQLVVHSSDEMNSDCLRPVYRVSYQSFEEVFSPRGGPLVVRGGRPTSLEKYAKDRNELYPAKPYWIRILNKVGARLSRVGNGRKG